MGIYGIAQIEGIYGLRTQRDDMLSLRKELKNMSIKSKEDLLNGAKVIFGDSE